MVDLFLANRSTDAISSGLTGINVFGTAAKK
jgi:hypothetical protein